MNRWLVGLVALLSTTGAGTAIWYAAGRPADKTPPPPAPAIRPDVAVRASTPLKEPTVRRVLQHRGYWPPRPVLSLSFSPDGKTLASAGAGLKLWDLVSDKDPPTPTCEWVDAAEAVAFSPDGKLLAWGNFDITVWDVPGRKQRFRLYSTDQGSVTGLSFRADSKVLASSHYSWNARLWDVETGRELIVFKGPVTAYQSVHFRPDGKMVATADHRGAWLWDVATGKMRALESATGGNVARVCFSPDGKTIACGSDCDGLGLWDVETGKKKEPTFDTSGAVFALCFSPDGKTLASAGPQARPGAEYRIVLWDVAMGRERLTLPDDELTRCLQFSPNGKLLACGNSNGKITVWELARD